MIAIPTLTTHREFGLGRHVLAFGKFLPERFLLELLIRISPFSAELLEICDGPVQLVCRTSIQRDLAQTAQSAVAWKLTYRIWWLERAELCGELRNTVGGTFDSQFFHPMSQGVRMHAESSGGAVRTLNHTACLL